MRVQAAEALRLLLHASLRLEHEERARGCHAFLVYKATESAATLCAGTMIILVINISIRGVTGADGGGPCFWSSFSKPSQPFNARPPGGQLLKVTLHQQVPSVSLRGAAQSQGMWRSPALNKVDCA